MAVVLSLWYVGRVLCGPPPDSLLSVDVTAGYHPAGSTRHVASPGRRDQTCRVGRATSLVTESLRVSAGAVSDTAAERHADARGAGSPDEEPFVAARRRGWSGRLSEYLNQSVCCLCGGSSGVEGWK